MRKPTFLFVFLLIAATQSVFAQCGIRRAEGFLQVRMPGIVPVDDNGEPVRRKADSSYSVVVELAGQRPKWTTAWINGKAYSIVATKTDFKSLDLTEKEGRKKVGWKLAAGRTLWLLDLVRSDAGQKTRKTPKGIILLLGTCNRKPFTRTVSHIRELTMPLIP